MTVESEWIGGPQIEMSIGDDIQIFVTHIPEEKSYVNHRKVQGAVIQRACFMSYHVESNSKSDIEKLTSIKGGDIEGQLKLSVPAVAAIEIGGKRTILQENQERAETTTTHSGLVFYCRTDKDVWFRSNSQLKVDIEVCVTPKTLTQSGLSVEETHSNRRVNHDTLNALDVESLKSYWTGDDMRGTGWRTGPCPYQAHVEDGRSSLAHMNSGIKTSTVRELVGNVLSKVIPAPAIAKRFATATGASETKVLQVLQDVRLQAILFFLLTLATVPELLECCYMVCGEESRFSATPATPTNKTSKTAISRVLDGILDWGLKILRLLKGYFPNFTLHRPATPAVKKSTGFLYGILQDGLKSLKGHYKSLHSFILHRSAGYLLTFCCTLFAHAMIAITSIGEAGSENWAYMVTGDIGDAEIRFNSFNERDSLHLIPYWTFSLSSNENREFSSGQPKDRPFAVRVEKSSSMFGKTIKDVFHRDLIYVGVDKEKQFWVIHFAGEVSPNKGRIRRWKLD